MQKISKPLAVSALFAVLPGFYGAAAWAQSSNAPQNLPTTASISGSYAYNFTAMLPFPSYGTVPFALQQSNPSSFNGANLSLTGSGANVSLTGQGSIAQKGPIGGIMQSAWGGLQMRTPQQWEGPQGPPPPFSRT